MFMLDTDVVSLVHRRSSVESQAIVRRVREVGPEKVGVSIITFEEQMRGWLAFVARAKGIEESVDAYDRLQSLLIDYKQRKLFAFTFPAAEHYSRLRKLKPRHGAMDLKNAAIAISQGLTFVTRNVKDFADIPGLTVEDWTRP